MGNTKVIIAFVYLLRCSISLALCRQNYLKEQPTERKVENRDINDHTSDTITYWACATREILYRIVNRLDLETGLDKASP